MPSCNMVIRHLESGFRVESALGEAMTASRTSRATCRVPAGHARSHRIKKLEGFQSFQDAQIFYFANDWHEEAVSSLGVFLWI